MKNITMTADRLRTYRENYSDRKFWNKLADYAVKAGKSVVRMALILYYELKDPNVSLKDKGIILGALGYFILTSDFIPDGMPFIGFTDDKAAMEVAYEYVRCSITPAVIAKADGKLGEWFK